uniref:Uncharacterized protein n=1 Tax=Glossina austeni TaxID=7395 RepID=A0A1A9UR92_GLOAU
MTPLDYQAIQCFGKVVIGGGDTDGDTMKNYATLDMLHNNMSKCFPFPEFESSLLCVKAKNKIFSSKWTKLLMMMERRDKSHSIATILPEHKLHAPSNSPTTAQSMLASVWPIITAITMINIKNLCMI